MSASSTDMDVEGVAGWVHWWTREASSCATAVGGLLSMLVMGRPTGLRSAKNRLHSTYNYMHINFVATPSASVLSRCKCISIKSVGQKLGHATSMLCVEQNSYEFIHVHGLLEHLLTKNSLKTKVQVRSKEICNIAIKDRVVAVQDRQIRRN